MQLLKAYYVRCLQIVSLRLTHSYHSLPQEIYFEGSKMSKWQDLWYFLNVQKSSHRALCWVFRKANTWFTYHFLVQIIFWGHFHIFFCHKWEKRWKGNKKVNNTQKGIIKACPLRAFIACAKYQAHSLFSGQGILRLLCIAVSSWWNTLIKKVWASMFMVVIIPFIA